MFGSEQALNHPEEPRRGASLMRSKACLALVLTIFGGAACSRRKRAPRTPSVPASTMPRVGWSERGIASWYGNPYHGRATASGEIYDMEQYTAAHRTLPFGAVVRVVSERTGKQVDVRINDRGPFFEGRVIDLSRAAARSINLLGPGTLPVRVQLVAYASAPSQDAFYTVQVIRFFSRDEAEQLSRRVERRHQKAELYARTSSGDEWIVRVGRLASEREAQTLAEELKSALGPAQVLRVERRAR